MLQTFGDIVFSWKPFEISYDREGRETDSERNWATKAKRLFHTGTYGCTLFGRPHEWSLVKCMGPSKWQTHTQLWQATSLFSCPAAVLTQTLSRKKQKSNFLALQNCLWLEMSSQLPKTLSLASWRKKHCPRLPVKEKTLLASARGRISKTGYWSLDAHSPGCCRPTGTSGCCGRCARWSRSPRAEAQRTPGWMHTGGRASCWRTRHSTGPLVPRCVQPRAPRRGLLGSRGGRQRPRWPPSWWQGWTLFPAGLCKIPVKASRGLIASCPQEVAAVGPHSLSCLFLLLIFSRIIWDHIPGLDILPSVLHCASPTAFSSPAWF